MKKKIILPLFLLLLSLGSNAQSLKETKEVTFFGIDYSRVKVFYARETPDDFKEAFKSINTLFFNEPDKYQNELESEIKAKVTEIRLDSTLARIDRISSDKNKFFSTTNKVSFDESYILTSVNNLNNQDASETGLIIIAKLLDKAKHLGYYEVVFFNTSTKELINHWEIKGHVKKHGWVSSFGLRNYWANSLIHAIGEINIKKHY